MRLCLDKSSLEGGTSWLTDMTAPVKIRGMRGQLLLFRFLLPSFGGFMKGYNCVTVHSV